MSQVKQELEAVLRNELNSMRNTPDFQTIDYTKHKDRFIQEVMENDNLLQELENVVHTFSQPVMKQARDVQAIIEERNDLEKRLVEIQHKFELLRKTNTDLHNRNTRVHDEIKHLQEGHFRKVKKENKCDHLVVDFNASEGLVFESAVKLQKVNVDDKYGAYRLECTKCGKVMR